MRPRLSAPVLLVPLLVAACAGRDAASASSAGDATKGADTPGKFECIDLAAAQKTDGAYRTLAMADAPPLPARTVAEKYSFVASDHDGDGIDDEYDLCPSGAEDGREPYPFDGCAADATPRRRGTWPDLPRVVVKGDRIEIAEQIHFGQGSAKILDSSKSLIAAIAQAIQENPEIELVEVAGHADRQGGAKPNLKLTDQRAKSVVDALVARGVDAKWLRSMGYGEYCPLDPASTKAAFAKNRRVEFRIIRRDGKDLTPSWGGCDEAEKQGIHKPAPPARVARAKSDKPKSSSKGAPEFHGSCRTRTPECETDCRGGSVEACYVGAHERTLVTEPAALSESRTTLKRECEAGLYPACSQLALSFSMDEPRDSAQALALAGPGCEKGDGIGCGVAASLLARGCTVSPDSSKGYALAKKGCGFDIEHAREHMKTSLAERHSCEVASQSLWSGLGGPKDHAASYALDQRACAAGLRHACLRLAQAALSEPALVTDRPKLVATLHDACEQEGWDLRSEECVAVANIEQPGEYTSPRLCEAGGQLECSKQCAAQDWEACMDLNISALYRGFYRRVDSLSPRGWVIRGLLEEAKVDRYKDSQAKIDEAAVDHYGKACTANVASGCIHHARMRLEGRGIFRDPSGAAKALDEWCAKGEKMACALLGHAAAAKQIPGGKEEAAKRMGEACKAGLKRACK